MGNILHGVKQDDGGSPDQPQVSVVLDCFQASAEESAPNQQPLGPHGGNGGGDAALALEFEATSMTKTFKANRATDGGGRTDLPVKSLNDDPHHPPSSLPEGVQFKLNTLPVSARCVGDGDGFTAYVEAADVPQGVHVAVDRYKLIGEDSNNREILACEYRIRMRGIDAPELQMQYGEESRNELVKLIEGKCAVIYVYGMDTYQRYVGDIHCDGVFIQEQMLKRGFAWHFEAYDKRPEFAQWQREAKAARRGLWSVDNPQKPWEWRKRHGKTKIKNEDSIQVELQSKDNLSSETLPGLIKKCKEAEDQARESNKKLESVVADNTKLNQQLRDLKKNNKESKKELESVVADNRKLNQQLRDLKKNNKESKKEMESVVAYNMKLNDQIQVLKTKNKEVQDLTRELKNQLEGVVADNTKLNHQLQNLRKKNKVAEDRAKQSKKEMESVVAYNMKLRDRLQGLKTKNKNAEDRAKQSEKEMESVVAENMKLNDQILELNKKNKKAVKFARRSKKKMQSVADVNMELHDKIQELKKNNKETEDGARQSRKELENALAENMELNDQVCDLERVIQEAEIRSTNWKSKLKRAVAEIMDLNDQLQELKRENNKARNLKEELENEKNKMNNIVNTVQSLLVKLGTSVLIIGLAVLYRSKGET